MRDQKRQFFVSLQGESIRIAEPSAKDIARERTLSLDPQTFEDAEALGEIQRALKKDDARLDVLVAEERVLRRRIRLPLAAQENLKEVLGFELDRHTPLKVQDVYFDYAIVETDRESKTIVVDVAVVPRSYLDNLVSRLRGAGLAPRTVSAWREGAKRPDAVFLKVDIERGATKARILTIALVGVVLTLDAAVAYLPLKEKLQVLDDLHARVEAVKTEAEQSVRLEQRLNELRDRNVHLVSLKKQAPSMAGLLDELARVLPNSAWLDQVQVRDGRVQIGGFASAAAELIGILEQSPMLSNVQFESPISADSTARADRFNISAQIESRPKDAS